MRDNLDVEEILVVANGNHNGSNDEVVDEELGDRSIGEAGGLHRGSGM